MRPFFDVTIFSYAVGLAKPDPEIYLQACRALGVLPQATIKRDDLGLWQISQVVDAPQEHILPEAS